MNAPLPRSPFLRTDPFLSGSDRIAAIPVQGFGGPNPFSDDYASARSTWETAADYAAATGVPVEPEPGLLTRAFGALDRFVSAGSGFTTGLLGADLTDEEGNVTDEARFLDLGAAFDRARRGAGGEHIGWGDTAALRFDEDDSGLERFAKGAAAFTGDVLSDPLTYISFGTSIGRGAASRVAAGQLTREVAEEAFEAAGRNALGEGAEGLARERLIEEGKRRVVSELDNRTILGALATGRGKRQFDINNLSAYGIDLDAAMKGDLPTEELVRLLPEEELDRVIVAAEDPLGPRTVEIAGKVTGDLDEQGNIGQSLLEIATNTLGEGAYRLGGARRLREELGRVFGDEMGERLFSTMHSDVRGGMRLRVPGVRVTPEGSFKFAPLTNQPRAAIPLFPGQKGGGQVIDSELGRAIGLQKVTDGIEGFRRWVHSRDFAQTIADKLGGRYGGMAVQILGDVVRSSAEEADSPAAFSRLVTQRLADDARERSRRIATEQYERLIRNVPKEWRDDPEIHRQINHLATHPGNVEARAAEQGMSVEVAQFAHQLRRFYQMWGAELAALGLTPNAQRSNYVPHLVKDEYLDVVREFRTPKNNPPATHTGSGHGSVRRRVFDDFWSDEERANWLAEKGLDLFELEDPVVFNRAIAEYTDGKIANVFVEDPFEVLNEYQRRMLTFVADHQYRELLLRLGIAFRDDAFDPITGGRFNFAGPEPTEGDPFGGRQMYGPFDTMPFDDSRALPDPETPDQPALPGGWSPELTPPERGWTPGRPVPPPGLPEPTTAGIPDKAEVSLHRFLGPDMTPSPQLGEIVTGGMTPAQRLADRLEAAKQRVQIIKQTSRPTPAQAAAVAQLRGVIDELRATREAIARQTGVRTGADLEDARLAVDQALEAFLQPELHAPTTARVTDFVAPKVAEEAEALEQALDEVAAAIPGEAGKQVTVDDRVRSVMGEVADDMRVMLQGGWLVKQVASGKPIPEAFVERLRGALETRGVEGENVGRMVDDLMEQGRQMGGIEPEVPAIGDVALDSDKKFASRLSFYDQAKAVMERSDHFDDQLRGRYFFEQVDLVQRALDIILRGDPYPKVFEEDLIRAVARKDFRGDRAKGAKRARQIIRDIRRDVREVLEAKADDPSTMRAEPHPEQTTWREVGIAKLIQVADDQLRNFVRARNLSDKGFSDAMMANREVYLALREAIEDGGDTMGEAKAAVTKLAEKLGVDESELGGWIGRVSADITAPREHAAREASQEAATTADDTVRSITDFVRDPNAAVEREPEAGEVVDLASRAKPEGEETEAGGVFERVKNLGWQRQDSVLLEEDGRPLTLRFGTKSTKPRPPKKELPVVDVIVNGQENHNGVAGALHFIRADGSGGGRPLSAAEVQRVLDDIERGEKIDLDYVEARAWRTGDPAETPSLATAARERVWREIDDIEAADNEVSARYVAKNHRAQMQHPITQRLLDALDSEVVQSVEVLEKGGVVFHLPDGRYVRFNENVVPYMGPSVPGRKDPYGARAIAKELGLDLGEVFDLDDAVDASPGAREIVKMLSVDHPHEEGVVNQWIEAVRKGAPTESRLREDVLKNLNARSSRWSRSEQVEAINLVKERVEQGLEATRIPSKIEPAEGPTYEQAEGFGRFLAEDNPLNRTDLDPFHKSRLAEEGALNTAVKKLRGRFDSMVAGDPRLSDKVLEEAGLLEQYQDARQLMARYDSERAIRKDLAGFAKAEDRVRQRQAIMRRFQAADELLAKVDELPMPNAADGLDLSQPVVSALDTPLWRPDDTVPKVTGFKLPAGRGIVEMANSRPVRASSWRTKRMTPKQLFNDDPGRPVLSLPRAIAGQDHMPDGRWTTDSYVMFRVPEPNEAETAVGRRRLQKLHDHLDAAVDEHAGEGFQTPNMEKLVPEELGAELEPLVLYRPSYPETRNVRGRRQKVYSAYVGLTDADDAINVVVNAENLRRIEEVAEAVVGNVDDLHGRLRLHAHVNEDGSGLKPVIVTLDDEVLGLVMPMRVDDVAALDTARSVLRGEAPPIAGATDVDPEVVARSMALEAQSLLEAAEREAMLQVDEVLERADAAMGRGRPGPTGEPTFMGVTKEEFLEARRRRKEVYDPSSNIVPYDRQLHFQGEIIPPGTRIRGGEPGPADPDLLPVPSPEQEYVYDAILGHIFEYEGHYVDQTWVDQEAERQARMAIEDAIVIASDVVESRFTGRFASPLDLGPEGRTPKQWSRSRHGRPRSRWEQIAHEAGFDPQNALEGTGRDAKPKQALRDSVIWHAVLIDDFTRDALKMWGRAGKWESFVGSVFEPYMRWFRTQATVGRGPGFVVRNLVGGLANARLVGATARDMLDGMSMSRMWRKANDQVTRTGKFGNELARARTKLFEGMVREAYDEERADELLEAHAQFLKMGLADIRQMSLAELVDFTGQSRLFDRKKYEDLNAVERVFEKTSLGVKPLTEKTADWTKWAEHALRFGSFMAGARRYGLGDGGYAASMLTRASQFDYADLSSFERNVMREIIPFYTFARKNLPLQMRGLITDPAKFAHLQRLMDTIHEAMPPEEGSQEEAYNDVLPEWFAENLGKVTGLGLGGGALGIRTESPKVALEEWLPGSLSGFRGAPRRALDTAVSQANPLLDVAVGGLTNRDPFTGQEIGTGDGSAGKLDYFARQVSPLYANAMRTLPLPWATERDESRRAGAWLSSIAGAPVTTVDEAAAKGALRARADELFDETAEALDSIAGAVGIETDELKRLIREYGPSGTERVLGLEPGTLAQPQGVTP